MLDEYLLCSIFKQVDTQIYIVFTSAYILASKCVCLTKHFGAFRMSGKRSKRIKANTKRKATEFEAYNRKLFFFFVRHKVSIARTVQQQIRAYMALQ